MDNLWLIYSLFALVLIGIYGFLTKIQAESKLSSNTFVFYNYIFLTLISFTLVWLLGGKLLINTGIISYALVTTVVYVALLYTRLEGLKYLSTSTYFINYRLLSSIGLVFIGIFFFQENISIKEFLGILLGFFIFYLLFEKKTENEKKVDFKKGILYLLFGIILATVSQVLSKYFVINNEDILSLYVYEGIFGTLLTLFISRKEKLKDIIYVPDKRFFSFLILSGGVFTVGGIYNLLAFQKGGDIAIVYKIISYSIFIPIVLSAIFYKEKITLRKIIAFILTILSIALFF